jgi:hypothetical protein
LLILEMNPQDLKNRTKQFALILECADMSALSKAATCRRTRKPTPKSAISNQQYEHDNSITSSSHDDLHR